MMEMNIPMLMAAPHAPQNPHAPSRNLASPAYHFAESFRQVNPTSGIMVCSQESGTNHDMMLRTMHVAERHIHHLPNYLYRIT